MIAFSAAIMTCGHIIVIEHFNINTLLDLNTQRETFKGKLVHNNTLDLLQEGKQL